MLEKVIDILKDYTNAVVEISADSKLIADLGLSSFDVINIVVAFENAFDIEVPDRVIPTFQTVQDIVDYVEKNV